MEQVSSDVGAGNEARTRYLHLGKVALYQMSYARILSFGPVIGTLYSRLRRH